MPTDRTDYADPFMAAAAGHAPDPAEPRDPFAASVEIARRARRDVIAPVLHAAAGLPADLDRATITRRAEAALAAAADGADPHARLLVEEIRAGARLAFPDATHIAMAGFAKAVADAVQGYVFEREQADERDRSMRIARALELVSARGADPAVAALAMDVIRAAMGG